ncbi:cobyric acid synthase [Mucispirillum schaedleri]|uniref:cobyric acid synthase n=1 Tax=Mucispirillum schaedleri TaxID=248039 RepID=UPI001F55AF57|nr:cobyric acid synthase [Mucispirillum schaedleri]
MAKCIMVQGTSSNVGKSLISAGLCRIFAQAGYKTAPFKSQNMALNSYITKDGLEIGRAQAVQAECAYQHIDVRFNPVLLKPTGSKTSQIIINGEIYGNMTAGEYFAEKHKFFKYIKESYESLNKEYDVIVIEGAGSPAEINLNHKDFVNMGMAQTAQAPVLLAGDIDKGGVFASLYGTVELLKEYKKYFKGFIINKFRGDKAILEPGLLQIEKLTGINVLGVLPYEKFNIDEEDSLAEILKNNTKGLIDIAVIRLPRISNFTDFAVFEYYDEVKVRYINNIADFGEPDLLIIPGTKNTIDDMKYIRSSGLITKIMQYAETGKGIIGVCGGYQMLTSIIKDPDNMETGGDVQGLNLIKAETVFEKEKIRTVIQGKFNNITGYFSFLNGAEFSGYEIHMGKTYADNRNISEIKDTNGNIKNDGLSVDNILGTYIHGIFDSSDIVKRIIDKLMQEKGIEKQAEEKNINELRNKEYDKLAYMLMKNLNISKIYEIMEKGV